MIPNIAQAGPSSSEPLPSPRASQRRPSLVTLPARLAAIFLLLVWVGPVTFVQTDSWHLLRWFGAPERASAESQLIPAGMAMLLEPGTPLRLHLHDGSIIEGRFRARTLLDSNLYARRFATYVRTSAYVPFALGETLHVTLRDGREWTASFEGYAELTLLLRSPDGSQRLRVPFESAIEIVRASGETVDPSDLARAFRVGLLPSAEALALEQRVRMASLENPVPDQVAVEDIASVSAQLRSGIGPAGVVVLSVVATLVVISLILVSAEPQAPSCSPDFTPGSWGVQLTERPFDRYRGCYVDDPLAVADPWPGAPEAGFAAAMDDATTPQELAK